MVIPITETDQAICWSLWTKASRRWVSFVNSSKSKEAIRELQREWISEQLIYISIRAFSKVRILSYETGYIATTSTTSSPLETKSFDRFKDIYKPRLQTKFHDNPTLPLKVVPIENQYFTVTSVLHTHLHYKSFNLKTVEPRISLQLFTFEINPLLTRHITKWTRWQQKLTCFIFKNSVWQEFHVSLCKNLSYCNLRP